MATSPRNVYHYIIWPEGHMGSHITDLVTKPEKVAR